MTFTANGTRQRLPLIFYSFLVILKHKNRNVFLTIHSQYKYFDSTMQRAEGERQKNSFLPFAVCRLPFAVNVMLNLSIVVLLGTAKKCTKIYNAGTQQLSCSLNILFSNSPVAVAVLLFLNSLLCAVIREPIIVMTCDSLCICRFMNDNMMNELPIGFFKNMKYLIRV